MKADKTDSNARVGSWWALLVPAPAVLLGVFVMAQNGIKPTLWGQNLAVWLVATTLCALASRKTPVSNLKFCFGRTVMWGAIVTLGLTLCCPGLDGAHRWLSFGPVRLHAASIVLPVFLIGLGDIESERGWRTTRWLILITAGLLASQPDAAQATAFAIAATLHRLFRRPTQGAMGFVESAAVWGLAIIAWARSDPLGSVPHVEGVLLLARAIGPICAAAAISVLCLLPLPFFAASHRWQCSGKARTALALGAYFAATLLAPIGGNFPVPLMGYGASPILGFFLGLGWLSLQSEEARSRSPA